jgi:hypothetical protein
MSSTLSSNTLAPLGAYLNAQPDRSNATNETNFEQQYSSFASLMGTRPQFYNAYTDYTQSPSLWPSSASYAATSFAQSGSSFVGPGSGTIPVIGVPMATPAYGPSTADPDPFYQQIISGALDADYTGIVDSWANAGFKTAEFRIGYEFNGFMPWTPAANGSDNADFVAAWQHIANLIHAEGTKDGITAKTVWNPATANGGAYDVQTLYPGDQYVDVVSTDVYGGGTPNNLVDFATGGTTVDSSYAAWAAKPANVDHYYLYENFTLGNLAPGLGASGASGYGWSVADTIAFAKLHTKPLGIDETGATSGQDDPVFPAWIASTLANAKAQGVTVDHVDIWSNGTATWDFVNGERPQEAAAWAANLGAGSATKVFTTIAVSAPGSVQEASLGAGVSVTETITTTNLTGNVFEEVLTASGAVESGYTAVALVNGVATSTVHMGQSGDVVQVVDNTASPTVTGISAPVTITDSPIPTPTITAPGTIQEASPGAGVTVPLTVTTTNLSSAIYYEVLTSTGSIESPYAAVLPNGAAITVPTAIPPQTTGQVFSVQVAFNYVPIRANLRYSQGSTNPPTTYTFASNPGITWDPTGQIATIPISNGAATPHYFQVEDTTTATPLLSAELLYQVGSSGGGGIIPVAPPSTPATTQTYTISPHLALSGDVVRVANNPTSPTVTATSLPVTITDPVVSAPTIALSAPGTVQEASVGAGVTVTETITTTNLTGNVYEEVLTAAGTVETPYTAVALTNGVATSSVHLAKSGDTIQVVDNTASPTVTAISTPVTITDPPVVTRTIVSSAPGTVQETTPGAGVTVPLTITTTNVPGAIYYEVLTSAGSVESPFTAVLPAGAAITIPTSIPQQKTGQTFSVQVAFNYVPIRANLVYLEGTTNPATAYSFASNPGITWDATGQLATIPFANGTAAPHFFQVEDTTTSSPLKSAVTMYQLGSSGGGGIVPVATPAPVSPTETFSISPFLAHSGDVVRAVDNPGSPTVAVSSAPVTITDLTVSAPGVAQEASVGAGVTVPLTVNTTNLSGAIYYEVLTSAGAVESPYTAALPAGAAITIPTVIPQQKSGQVFAIQVAFNYVPNRANLVYLQGTTNPATAYSFASNPNITWDATGQVATIPISNGLAAPHFFQVEDTTTSSPLKSAVTIYQVGSSGGGGTVPVTPPTPVSATETFTIPAHLAKSGDVVQVVNNPTSPSALATSTPVTITDPNPVTPQTTWDPTDTGGWALSNGNLTATSPDNNTPQSIFVAFGEPSIPDHAETYFEYRVSGAAIQTAFTVGFGIHGFNPSNQNIADEGAIIPNATFLGFSYNLTITNTGDVIYDPQGNATYAQTHPGAIASPNQWPDGSIIGVLVNRINNTAEFTLNGVVQGGPFDISGLAGKVIYPYTATWNKSGPVATINGGANGFTEPMPAGYTALDNTTTAGVVANSIETTVNDPAVALAAPDTSGTDPAPINASGSTGSDNVTAASPATVTIGSGPDTLALQISEDAWNGDALFTVSVDGKQIGGPQTATASHAAGQTQTFDILGNFAAGNHTATVNFLNDAYGGSSTADRNLYVTGATIDGSTVSGAALAELTQGPRSFTFLAPGSTPATDTVTLTAPASVVAGVQTVTGTESVPSQPVFLDWRTGAAPTLTASDWVQATVEQTGRFSASVDIAPSGTRGTMYYHTGAGVVLPGWSAAPT